MGKTVPNAFTLVELLVVIAIMATIGAYSLANYRNFGEDQSLRNAVLDVQSIFRQAQASATAKAVCNTQYDATWQVRFTSNVNVVLQCQETGGNTFPKKTLSLNTTNTSVDSFFWVGSNCPGGLPVVGFNRLNGSVDFGDANCTTLRITLKSAKTGRTRDLNVEQGGRIYAP